MDGGWMVDQRETPGTVDNARSRQMAALRKLCIPQLTFLLMKALEESGLAAEFTEVVDVIASEKQALYEEFGDEELRTLLQKSRAASIILLDQGFDALGFPLQ
uniref:Nuclear pore complex protein n=1 Tax=Rhipicephalus zambeziensis TaxID=60191 RepID=A0A224Z5E5_9ACAR